MIVPSRGNSNLHRNISNYASVYNFQYNFDIFSEITRFTTKFCPCSVRSIRVVQHFIALPVLFPVLSRKC